MTAGRGGGNSISVKPVLQVASSPVKPLMIFDGDCRFCAFWIRRWERLTGDQMEYLPFQDERIATSFPEIPAAQFSEAVQLVEPGGKVFAGAAAVFRSLAYNPHYHWLLDWYENSAGFARFADVAYAFVARHRTFFSFLTRVGWGLQAQPPTQILVRWLFLRSLGLIYLIAFVSLWGQIGALVGGNGILPATTTMERMAQYADVQKVGLDRFRQFPTLCWFGAGDTSLKLQCAAGTLLAVLLIGGVAPAPCLFLLWLVYLSLATVCREFLGFQWDILLLQVGFLAIFFAPLQLRPGLSREAPPSRLALWLLRWLLFLLMFESGVVKRLSGDLTWKNLTALNYHYETQPLPTWPGWYAHQFPEWVQQASTVAMFGIELYIPFLIFAPRRFRHFAAFALALLQAAILITGNYCFFNLLTLALCLLLLDDFTVLTVMPSRFRTKLSARIAMPGSRRGWSGFVLIPVACVSVAISLMQLSALFKPGLLWPGPMAGVYQWLSPLRTFNHYGLFAVMTTSRPEIVVEGSDDGVVWKEYEFKYKPGDVKRRPGFVAPHQPRLDWQMWFAALGNYRQNPWFINFCYRLLQGSPEVISLLAKNPFPQAPPRYIRAVVYDYHFTDFAMRRKTGAWWRRELKGDYLPVMSLDERAPRAARP